MYNRYKYRVCGLLLWLIFVRAYFCRTNSHRHPHYHHLPPPAATRHLPLPPLLMLCVRVCVRVCERTPIRKPQPALVEVVGVLVAGINTDEGRRGLRFISVFFTTELFGHPHPPPPLRSQLPASSPPSVCPHTDRSDDGHENKREGLLLLLLLLLLWLLLSSCSETIRVSLLLLAALCPLEF